MTARKPGRPHLHSGPLGGRTRRVSLTLPAALLEEIDQQASEASASWDLRVSRSAIATYMLREFLEAEADWLNMDDGT